MPPLRNHRCDIPHIAEAILANLLPKGSRIRIAEPVMAKLLQAPWHGNVRELKNLLRRSLVMSDGKIIERLEPDLRQTKSITYANHRQSKAAEQLIKALIDNEGRLQAVAHELNVSVRTVQRRMKEFGLNLRDFRTI